MKEFYDEIYNHYLNNTSWEELNNIYKQKHNELNSRFKKICQKN